MKYIASGLIIVDSISAQYTTKIMIVEKTFVYAFVNFLWHMDVFQRISMGNFPEDDKSPNQHIHRYIIFEWYIDGKAK